MASHKNEHTDQWNRTDSPEITPFVYGQFIHDKGDQNTQWGKRFVSSTNRVEKLDSHPQNNETALLPYTLHKRDSKWIKDLHVRPEAIKFLKEYRE